MPDLAATQKAVAGLALQRPDLVSLARLASVAAVVEPSLLRRLRKEAGHVARVATTHLEDAWDAGLEADLWFSSLAHVVTADQLTLRADVLEILRSQLAGPPTKSKQRPRDGSCQTPTSATPRWSGWRSGSSGQP